MEKGRIEFNDPSFRKTNCGMCGIPYGRHRQAFCTPTELHDWITTPDEKKNQIAWFRDLLETLDAGDIESTRQAIVGAIKLLER